MTKGRAMAYHLEDDIITRIAEVAERFGTSRSHVLRAMTQEQLPLWEDPEPQGLPDRLKALRKAM